MGTILNGKNQPINIQTGSIPDVSGALKDRFQYMTFETVAKAVVGFEVQETGTTVSFWGIIMPLSPRALQLKPEGQRAWTWLQIIAEPALSLDVDDVVTYNGTQTRIMSKTDYSLYGYVTYEAVQDWTGAGP